MAMFRQHIALGTILSTAGVIVIYFYALATDPFILGIIFALCAVGSFLPDVDSDSGLPFYLMFGAATLGFAGVVLYFTLAHQPANHYVLVGVPLAALVFFWFVIGGVFKECTHHRGIWHSLPALGIAATATFVVARYFDMTSGIALLFAGAMAVGFLSHLVLDEIWSEVDIGGVPFVPKKSLGTALKLFSHSTRVNLFAYTLLAVLIYMAVHPVIR